MEIVYKLCLYLSKYKNMYLDFTIYKEVIQTNQWDKKLYLTIKNYVILLILQFFKTLRVRNENIGHLKLS